MSNITSVEYWKEVSEIAKTIAQEAMEHCDNDRDEADELINDSLLHETIDGHEWIIYYSHNLDVIQHSDNEDYMIDNFGIDEAGSILKDKGLSGLHSAIAFWALYADVSDQISDCLDNIETALEDDEDEETEE